MDTDDLVEVYTTNDAMKADIISGALHSNGIKCKVDGETQAGLTGILEIKLLVLAEDYDKARSFIEQHES